MKTHRKTTGVLATSLGATLALTSVLTLPTLAFAAPSPSKAGRRKGGNFGLGASLGDPMGASAKLFLHPNHALQWDLGWAPLHHGDGRLGMDYLWHPATIAGNSVVDFGFYLGIGLGLAFWAGHGYYYGYHGHNSYRRGRDFGHGGAAMFIRAPVPGMFLHWQTVPLDTVLEGSWSPYVILPDLGHGDVSAKVRYYF
jgi:hypothetical protein